MINRLNLGGPTFNAAYLSKYLAPEYETLLVSGMKDDTEASSEFILKEMGITPVYIPTMKREINIRSDAASFRRIRDLIREFKPDIVHTHAAKAGAIGRLAASVCEVPVLVHTFHGHVFHSYFNSVKTRVFVEIEKYLARKSSAIIAISERQKTELSEIHKICPANKIKVVPLGFELERFRENKEEKRKLFRGRFNVADDEIAIGIIGRIVPIKNHKFFLMSVKELMNQTSRKLRIFIVGDGEYSGHIKNLATELDLNWTDDEQKSSSSLITFTSWIREIDVVLNGLDIIALTSLNEGTPVSLIEAQAAGKPIVSTNVGGIENAVMPNVTALLSDIPNVDAFATNMTRLAESDEMRIEFGKSGWDFVNKKFNYTRLVSDFRNLYSELLENSRTKKQM